jgi:hypothetical protein
MASAFASTRTLSESGGTMKRGASRGHRLVQLRTAGEIDALDVKPCLVGRLVTRKRTNGSTAPMSQMVF